jgi:hypothetical protein
VTRQHLGSIATKIEQRSAIQTKSITKQQQTRTTTTNKNNNNKQEQQQMALQVSQYTRKMDNTK